MFLLQFVKTTQAFEGCNVTSLYYELQNEKKMGTAQQVALTLAQPLYNMHKILPLWQDL